MRTRKQGKSMKAQKLIGLMTAAGIAAAGLLTPATAQASVQEACSGDYGCLWWDQDMKGRAIHIDGNIDDLGTFTNGDRAHSVWNSSGYWMALYEDSGPGGLCIQIKPGPTSRVWDLSAYNTGGRHWGDRVSAVRFYQNKQPHCVEVRSG